jgi:hypothetical protein
VGSGESAGRFIQEVIAVRVVSVSAQRRKDVSARDNLSPPCVPELSFERIAVKALLQSVEEIYQKAQEHT